MSTYDRIVNAYKSGALSEREIAKLIRLFNSQGTEQVENEDLEISNKLIAELHRRSADRNGKHNCPYCGFRAESNGSKNGRPRYKCKNPMCKKTFGVTNGTFYYCSKLSAEQWERFIELTLRGQSLRVISRDMGINLSTAFNNRHKLCDFIEKLEQEQDVFSTITEVDEYYTPLSYSGLHDKRFFIESGRMPNHHRNYDEKVEYVEDAGYDLDDIGELAGFDDDDELPSNNKFT